MDKDKKSPETEIQTEVLKITLKSQYSATFAMLRQAIELCPDDLWLDESHTNRTWWIAYHATYFTHMYAQVNDYTFKQLKNHPKPDQFSGTITWPPRSKQDPKSPPTREDILLYIDYCESNISPWVDLIDLTVPKCGFWWYKGMDKLEHQFNNLRHIQHHIGQLADRVRNVCDEGGDWVGGIS